MFCGSGPEARLVDAVLYIVRHRQVVGLKNAWLVHVIPKTGEAFRQELLVERTPPIPGFFLRELRKNRGAWPNRSDISRPFTILHKMVSGETLLLRPLPLARNA